MPDRGVTITEPEYAPVIPAGHPVAVRLANADPADRVRNARYTVDLYSDALRDGDPKSDPDESDFVDPNPHPFGEHPDDPHDFPELTPEQHTNVADWYDRDAERSAYDADSISAHLRSDDPDGNGLRVYYAERATFHRERAAHHRAAAAR